MYVATRQLKHGDQTIEPGQPFPGDPPPPLISMGWVVNPETAGTPGSPVSASQAAALGIGPGAVAVAAPPVEDDEGMVEIENLGRGWFNVLVDGKPHNEKKLREAEAEALLAELTEE